MNGRSSEKLTFFLSILEKNRREAMDGADKDKLPD